MTWVHPDADLEALPLRRLERIDMYGNRVVVTESRSRAWLERRRAELEARAHKQSYEIHDV